MTNRSTPPLTKMWEIALSTPRRIDGGYIGAIMRPAVGRDPSARDLHVVRPRSTLRACVDVAVIFRARKTTTSDLLCRFIYTSSIDRRGCLLAADKPCQRCLDC